MRGLDALFVGWSFFQIVLFLGSLIVSCIGIMIKISLFLLAFLLFFFLFFFSDVALFFCQNDFLDGKKSEILVFAKRTVFHGETTRNESLRG